MDSGSQTLSQSKMDTVKVVSNDGKSFSIPRKALGHSRVLHEMEQLLGSGGEPIPLPNVDGNTLRIVTKWMWAHVDDSHEYTCHECENGSYVRNPKDTKLFGANKCNDMQRTKLANAANFLEVPRLTDAVFAEIADIVKHLSLTDVLKRLKIGVDKTEEELKKLREEHPWLDI